MYQESDYEEINKWHDHFKDYFPEHVNCRYAPGVPTKEELWHPVFYTVCDYDEFVKEHKN